MSGSLLADKTQPKSNKPITAWESLNYKFTTFGAGVRACIGRQLSIMEMKQLVFLLLLKFKFETVEKLESASGSVQGAVDAAAIDSDNKLGQEKKGSVVGGAGVDVVVNKRTNIGGDGDRDAGGGELDSNRHWEISIPFVRTKEALQLRLTSID